MKITKYDIDVHAEEAEIIFKMAWKISLSTLCRTLLPAITAAFLGHLGSEELAASALSNIWVSGLQIVIYGFSCSLCTLCGQAYGAGNFKLVGIWLQLGLLTLTLISVPMAISFCYISGFLSYFNRDPKVLELASIYAQISALSIWPQCMYCALRQYFQAQEIINPGTVVSFLSVLVSIVFNYVFIYGIPDVFPGFGFIGSPLAQVAADLFQLIALYWYCFVKMKYHSKTWYGWQRSCLRVDRISKFLSLSMSMTLNVALDEWIYSAITAIASTLGPLQLAANSVLYTLWNLIYSIYWGFGLPTQVRVANFLGSNDQYRAKQTTRVGFVLGSLSSIGTALVVYYYQVIILDFFTSDQELANVMYTCMPVFCVAVGISGLHIVLASVVEAMSLAKTLLTITFIGSWVILFPLSYFFGIFYQHGLIGLWYGSICGELTKFVLMVIALCQVNWLDMCEYAMKQSEYEVNTELNVFQLASCSISTPSMFSPVIPNRLTYKYHLKSNENKNRSRSHSEDSNEEREALLKHRASRTASSF